MAKTEKQLNIPAHAVITDPHTIVVGSKCIYSLLPLLYTGSMFPKLSLLFLYRRIFPSRAMRIATLITMCAVLAAGIAFTLVGLFACWPVPYFWDRSIPGGRCISLNTFYRTETPINILVDGAILLLPMPALWKLQAPRSRKVGLTIVFITGGL